MKKLFLILCVAIFLCGCNITGAQNNDVNYQSEKNDQPTRTQISELTKTLTFEPTVTQIPQPTLTPTIKPSPTEGDENSNLDWVQIGWIYSDFSITYDPNIWMVIESKWGEHGETYNQLKLIEDPNCILLETMGMGVVRTVEIKTEGFQEKMGSFDCKIIELQNAETGEVFLIEFNFDEELIFITVIPGNDPSTCVDAARTAIQNSAKNAFGPIE